MSPGISLGDRSPRDLKFKLKTHSHSVLSSIRNQGNHIKHEEGGLEAPTRPVLWDNIWVIYQDFIFWRLIHTHFKTGEIQLPSSWIPE